MQFARLSAGVAFCAAFLQAQAPVVEVNPPGEKSLRFFNVTLDLPARPIFGAPGMEGFPLERCLDGAGWGKLPSKEVAKYVVKIVGDETATLPLSQVLGDSFEGRVWFVTKRDGAPVPESERPLVIALGQEGAASTTIKNVLQVRVLNSNSADAMDDGDFARLSEYGTDGPEHILWKKYDRWQGLAMLVLTTEHDGKFQKSAVLLSDQVAKWDDKELSKRIGHATDLGLHPEGAIVRQDKYTVVPLRFPF